MCVLLTQLAECSIGLHRKKLTDGYLPWGFTVVNSGRVPLLLFIKHLGVWAFLLGLKVQTNYKLRRIPAELGEGA